MTLPKDPTLAAAARERRAEKARERAARKAQHRAIERTPFDHVPPNIPWIIHDPRTLTRPPTRSPSKTRRKGQTSNDQAKTAS